MKAYIASLTNAVALIALSLWGYFSSDSPSLTALIPTFIGVVLLILNSGVKNENKIIAHIAVLLTLIVLIGLIKPFMGAMAREDNGALIRVTIMILSTIIAIIFFVKSFINARKTEQLLKTNRDVIKRQTTLCKNALKRILHKTLYAINKFR